MRRYLEGWLRARVSADAASAAPGEAILSNLPRQAPAERMLLAQAAVGGDPVLTRAVNQLSVYDRLRLSVDLLHGTSSVPLESTSGSRCANAMGVAVITHNGCCAGPHHRHRLPRQ
jgi:hypothetical protein